MGGKHQLVFAKHDYCNTGSFGGTFKAADWQNGMGGTQIKHLIWENEFGNFNAGAGAPTSDNTWSSNMAAAARDKFTSMLNFAGGAPFLFGPWSDANAITATNNSTPTSPWGDTVKNIYFGSASPPPSGITFSPGVVANGSTSYDADAKTSAISLGAKVVRQEFNINDDVSVAGAARTNADNIMTQYANAGIKVLMLAGGPAFTSSTPTSGQVANIAGWAARYGPGGAFWTGVYGGTDRPITHIEFGNEESYSYKAGTRGSPGYLAIAANYANKFSALYTAVQSANPGVGLLCIADADGSDNVPWVNQLFNSVPTIASMVAGWVCHAYGPTYPTRVNSTLSAVGNRGAPATIPLDITETGVACDESPPGTGRTLNDNYGWANNMTYAQAATTLRDQTTAIRTGINGVLPANAARVRHYMLYQAHDNQDSGGGIGNPPDKEGFFGAQKKTSLADKGSFATQYRTILAL